MATSENQALSNAAAARADARLKAVDAAGEAPATHLVPVQEQMAFTPGVAPLNVTAQEQTTPIGTPADLAPPRPPRAASVGPGSSRSAGPLPPFVPQTARAAPASSVGAGAGRRTSPAPFPESVLQAAAANQAPAPAPKVLPKPEQYFTPRVFAPARNAKK